MENHKKISKLINSGTRSEVDIAQYMLSNFPFSAMSSLKEISEKTGVSIPTVQRMVIKLGFSGFSEFKKSIIKESTKERNTSPLSRMQFEQQNGISSQKNNYLHTVKNIQATFANLPSSLLPDVVKVLADDSRPVWCLGGRFTGSLTTLFARHLKTIRPRVREYSFYTGSLADVYINTDKDTVLFITDIRRYDQSIFELCKACKAEGATIILVTDNWHSPAEEYADFIIPVYTTLASGWDSNACLLVVLEEIMGLLTELLGEKGQKQLNEREKFVNIIK